MTVFVGDTEVISVTIRDDDELLADPTTLTLKVTTPALVETTYTYGVHAALVRDGKGKYHLNQVVSALGNWKWRWTGVGVVNFVLDGNVVVHPVPVAVTIHIQDAGAVSVASAFVTVVTSGGSIAGAGTTDASGNVTLLLEPLVAYKVSAEKGGAIVPYSAGAMTPANTASQTFNFSVTALSLSAPTAPRTVWLYGWVQQMGGAKADDATVFVETVGYKVKSTSAGARTLGQRLELRSDSNGVWGCAVHAGARVRVTIPSSRVSAIFTVPDETTVTTLNFADVRPDPGPGGEVGITADVPTFDSLKGVS